MISTGPQKKFGTSLTVPKVGKTGKLDDANYVIAEDGATSEDLQLSVIAPWNGNALVRACAEFYEWKFKGENGETPVMLAAERGCLETVKQLLRLRDAQGRPRFDVDAQDDYDKTALMKAAERGWVNMTSLLLGTFKADPHLDDWNGSTALLLAAQNGHPGVVVRLLAFGADPFAEDRYDQRASTLAFQRYQEYLERGQNHPWYAQCIDEVLTRYEARLHFFMWAARRDDDSALRYFFRNQPLNPDMRDSSGRTALIWAMQFANPRGVEFLLSKGANPNAQDDFGSTPLMWGLKFVDRVLKGGSEKTKKPQTEEEHRKAELRKKADRIRKTKALWKSEELMRQFIFRVASLQLDIKDGRGRTALHIAQQKHRWTEVYYLIFLNCDLDVVNNEEFSPRMHWQKDLRFWPDLRPVLLVY